MGFGISTPEHVQRALASGAAGAISGSAVVRRGAEQLQDPAEAALALARFVAIMKHATRAASAPSSPPGTTR